jgi:hypothetical protein
MNPTERDSLQAEVRRQNDEWIDRYNKCVDQERGAAAYWLLTRGLIAYAVWRLTLRQAIVDKSLVWL